MVNVSLEYESLEKTLKLPFKGVQTSNFSCELFLAAWNLPAPIYFQFWYLQPNGRYEVKVSLGHVMSRENCDIIHLLLHCHSGSWVGWHELQELKKMKP